MCVPFVQRTLVYINYISVCKLHFRYMCILFSLFVLRVFYCISCCECYFYVCVPEHCCDCSRIGAIICEGGPFAESRRPCNNTT
jgi:hypothetical protein